MVAAAAGGGVGGGGGVVIVVVPVAVLAPATSITTAQPETRVVNNPS